MNVRADATADEIRAAHAATTAIVNRMPDELAEALLNGCRMWVAVAVTQVTLRYAIEEAEKQIPGFRDEVLAFIGRAFAEHDDDDELTA